MKYLLDTNVISEIRKIDRTQEGFRRWWQNVDANEIYLSVLVVGELRQGIERLRPRDPGKAAGLETWLETLVLGFGTRILAIDLMVANHWGQLGALRTLPLVDSLLAATAIAHNLTLVTRNVDDIRDSGVHYLNPFDG